MARVDVTVDGLDELRTALSRLGRDLRSAMDEAQRDAAREVAEEWRAGVPVETGEYAASIDSDQDSAFAEAEHGPFVEFGTSTHPPQPAGREAASRVADRMPDQIADRLRRELP